MGKRHMQALSLETAGDFIYHLSALEGFLCHNNWWVFWEGVGWGGMGFGQAWLNKAGLVAGWPDPVWNGCGVSQKDKVAVQHHINPSSLCPMAGGFPWVGCSKQLCSGIAAQSARKLTVTLFSPSSVIPGTCTVSPKSFCYPPWDITYLACVTIQPYMQAGAGAQP